VRGSRYTRSRLPVSLEYLEEQPNQSKALKRELAIKSLSRKAKEALIQLAKRVKI
jgi:predicted GIY-YIG superfamily endonuclease